MAETRVDVESLLRRFGSSPIECVWLLRDEIGLTFDGGVLTCASLPRIRADGRDLPVAGGDWLRALWTSIGATPRDVRFREGVLAFELGSFGFAIDVDEHPGVEAAVLHVEDKGVVVFARGDG